MRRKFLFSFVITLYFFTFTCVQQVFCQTIAIVVNVKTPVEKIDNTDIKRIYTGYTKFWDDKSKIVLTELVDVIDIFIEKVLNMTKNSYKSIWKKNIFAEGLSAPKQIKTADELLEFVSWNKNSIGFLKAEDVKHAYMKDVKVILTIKTE